jgi:hypothetical protein
MMETDQRPAFISWVGRIARHYKLHAAMSALLVGSVYGSVGQLDEYPSFSEGGVARAAASAAVERKTKQPVKHVVRMGSARIAIRTMITMRGRC